jgi:hypothetical protein
VGAWSPSLDGDLEPVIGVERVGLACAWVQARRVFSGYPSGHIDSQIAVSMQRYGLTTLWHRSKKWQMKD